MKLRAKILLSLGIVLFLMVLIMYVIPTYFVKKDVYRAAEEIHQLILEDQKQLLASQTIWTNTAFEKTKENLNSLLFMLYEMKNLSKAVVFNKENSLSRIWEALTSIAGLDPDIGFVQAHAPKIHRAAALTTTSANIYPALSLTEQKNAVLFELESNKDGVNRYIGLKLPQELQVDQGYTYYAFANVKNVPTEVLEIHKEIFAEVHSLTERENQSELSIEKLRGFSFAMKPSSKGGFFWALKMHMIRLLVPLYVKGLSLPTISSTLAPEGIVRVDSSKTGFAILTKEIFEETPLFDDQSFYEKHPPLEGPPIAAATPIFVARQKSPFMGQILLLDGTYLTLGSPLDSFAKDLALSSNKIILMQVNQSFWLGYDGNGNRLDQGTLNEFVKTSFQEDHGILKVNSQDFYFSRLSSLENGEVRLFQIQSFLGQNTILGTLFKLENRLSNKISLQLLLISCGAVLLVLIFIGRIGLHVIYPIRKLALATEDVVRGRYDEVKLPDVGKSRDEIAILTHSFADMVKGLEEREKIRGVLDKVVSKDVADEILRTQIHLGGEDRVVTMLFSDIRDFSNLTENLSPQETIQILNACMTKVSRVIEGEGGVIDKYVGDEVMAIFGAPTRHPDHALRAVSSGILIVETLKKWNLQRVQNNHPPIEMGIGIHSGLVVAGNMGAEDRLNYTVLGANVNLAARLCEVAARNQLIISEHTLKEPNIEESFYVKALTPISLKGFSEPVPIYEVVGFKWEET